MTIPLSYLIDVTPSVVGTGGSGIDMNAVFLTETTSVPIGSVMKFSSLDSVSAHFGATSTEYAMAAVYFNGFEISTIKPSVLYFAQFPTAAVPAYLRSASLSSMTLAELKALSGTLTITIDGTAETSSTIDLSSVTSFSDAASHIAAGFTGSLITCAYSSQLSAFIITTVATGETATISYATGTLSEGLLLTAALGAVTSQGSDAAVPATLMDSVKNVTQDWATFMTIWEPDLETKTLFADWSNNQAKRYLYSAWDSSALAYADGNTTAMGPVFKAAGYNGVICTYSPTGDKAAFLCGYAASIDWSRKNGRADAAYKYQSGLTADVTDETMATNLEANGYNFYGIWREGSNEYSVYQRGQIPGVHKFVDSFLNQIRLNSQFRLYIMELMMGVNSLPYNKEDGYDALALAMQDPINEALNFGSIHKGVSLSNTQKATVNAAAGLDISGSLYAKGYYRQILDPTAQVRGERGTPVINFWYMDGESIQRINIASIDIL